MLARKQKLTVPKALPIAVLCAVEAGSGWNLSVRQPVPRLWRLAGVWYVSWAKTIHTSRLSAQSTTLVRTFSRTFTAMQTLA